MWLYYCCFSLRGRVTEGQYVGELERVVFTIDKDHFSLTEMKCYTKDIGYDKVEGFYVKDLTNIQFVALETDSQLYNIVKDLRTGSIMTCM